MISLDKQFALTNNSSNFMKNYSTFASFGAALCLATSTFAAAEPASGPRDIIPLDTGWRFHQGDDPASRQPGFDDANWRTLYVPHDWSVESAVSRPPEGDRNNGYFAHGIGWYRKSFTLPRAAGKKVVVEFDGVYMNSEVWINGQFLGRRPYGFIGFRYDLTQYLKTNDSPNVLAVRVDDSLEPSLRWYAGSGIYRHVRLLTTSYTHFRLDGGITVTTPRITAEQASVEASYIIDAHFFSEEERQAWARDNWGVHPPGRGFLRQRRSCGRLGVPPRPLEGDGLQCHSPEPSSVRSGVLRPVRSTRLLRLR
jgi:hypothetical protein